MKQKSLKSYVNDKYMSYLMTYELETVSFTVVKSLAAKDERLAELAYLKYLLQGSDKYKAFAKKAQYQYDDMLELVADYGNKYVRQYRNYKESLNSTKDVYKNALLKLKENNNLTMYALSKALKTNQSNASQFFLKGQYQALSEKKLKEAYDYLKAKYEN